jgi:hypothetical protein
MQLEIDLLLISGAVRIIPESEPIPDHYVISRVFPVPKKDQRVRLVINLRTINPYVPAIHFKMEGLRSLRDVIRQGDWMVKLDLQDAFHHLPIHPKARPFFRFQWGKVLYEWQAVPFGYRDAPRVFTRVMRAVATAARQLGIRLIVYMDDILVLSHSQEQAIKDRDNLLQLLESFGWSLNIKKCHFIPTQLIDFLGVMVDSQSMKFYLPSKKLDALRARVLAMRLRALKGKRIPLFQLQSLVGHLQSVSDCILPCRLHSNSLIEALRLAQLHHYTTLTPLAIKELLWWENNIVKWNGKDIIPTPPKLQFDTDASEKGWGAVHYPIDNSRRIDCQGFFTSVMTSNTRELTAIQNGVVSLVNRLDWTDSSIRVRTDNQTAMSYINRMGGRSPHLCRIAEEIHAFCFDRKLLLTAEYLPGVENVVADQLSRIGNDISEQQLNPVIFRLIDRVWGPHTIDACASGSNTQLHNYVSLRTDTGCQYTDIFSRRIPSHENPWCFPPFPIIGRLLRKIEKENLTLTLIVPVWPNQPWWPMLWPLCQDWPILLPQSQHFLLSWQEGSRRASPTKWSWIALRLSNNTSDHKVFRNQVLMCGSSATSTENVLARTVALMAFGKDIVLGAPLRVAAQQISKSLISFATRTI